VTLTDTVIYPFAVVMNLDRWNRLPDAVKKVMTDLSREQAEWTGTYMDDHVREAVEWSKGTHGVEFIDLSPEEKGRWDARLEPITAQWIADHKGAIPAEAIVEEIRILTAAHAR